MNISKNADNWIIQSPVSLTDAEAQEITFLAEPKQVVMGELVTVSDPEGTRIGHVAVAHYLERFDGPAYVRVTISLR